jgi:hypothetical protein
MAKIPLFCVGKFDHGPAMACLSRLEQQNFLSFLARP